jgi:putative glycosyltransferase (TIGR04372 family)
MHSKGRPGQVPFWRRNVGEIKEGGRSVLFQKCLRALQLVAVIPILLLLRALRPFVLVRFGQLNSISMGMFAQATELYLCEREAGLQPKRTFDIFHCSIGVSNQQLKKMWGRTLHIPRSGELLAHANDLMPGGTPYKVRLPNDEDRHGVIPGSSVHLFFTAEEERWGEAGLRDLGLPEGAPFVCIYARDTGYKGRDTGHKWSSLYNQDEGLHGYRNSSIDNLVPAAEELVRRGYFIIRMGAVVNEGLATANPMIIDYATRARSDFMDIFLCARCRFFLGDTGGLNTVPRIFRRPVVTNNFIVLSPGQMLPVYPYGLIIPKKLWLREKRQYMTFREFIPTMRADIPMIAHLDHIGVDVIENTPEEIYAVAVEMEERLKGTWQTTEQDEELQQRVWSLLEIREPNEELRPRIGAEFLRLNQELLD